MRGYIVLLAVGIVAALIGVGVLAAGFSPQTHPLFFAISAGANRYVRYQFSVVTGGSVSGTFAADTGTVNVWVMTDAQHTAFISTGTLSYLSATSGASGAFSADLPSGGTYFVETGHGGGYESTTQTGTEEVTINALPTSPFVTSVVILAVGAILLGVGLWWRTKPARPAATWSMPPPYMPAGAYCPPPMPGGVAPPPSGLPGWPPGSPVTPLPAAVPLIGTVLVTVENGSATDETVDLLANGVSVATLQSSRSGAASRPCGCSSCPRTARRWPSRPCPAVAVARNSRSSWRRKERLRPPCGFSETRFEPTTPVVSFPCLRARRCIQLGSGMFPYTISAVSSRFEKSNRRRSIFSGQRGGMQLSGRSGTSRTLALVLAMAMVAGSLGVITVSVVAMNPTNLLALGKLSPEVLAAAFQGEASVRVLVETIGHPSAQLVDAIGAMGGTVVSRFAYTPALAAYVPSNRLASLAQISSVKHVFLDDLVNVAAAPSMGGLSASTLFDVQAVEGDSQAVDLTAEQMAQFSPENFYNSELSGVTPAVLTATGGGANTVLGLIDPGMKLIPLIGIAPEANLYIIKVFDHTGLGVPTSIILAGINAAISARVDDGVDIDKINMSLGGATLFDGRDLEDMTVDFATSQGILPVS